MISQGDKSGFNDQLTLSNIFFFLPDQLTLNQRTLHSLNQLTVNSMSSFNPANDPESMVAFLPNVRRNTMERAPSGEDPR
jgi:hypothetical protein